MAAAADSEVGESVDRLSCSGPLSGLWPGLDTDGQWDGVGSLAVH